MISLSLYQDIFEASDVGMVIADLSGRLTKVNQSLCDCLGYTKEELESKTFHEITYEADLKKDLYHIDAIRQGKMDSYRTQKRYMTKSGELVWADVTVTPLRKSDKGVNCFFAVIKNIDQLKHSQELLHARNEELEAIFATSKDGIAVLDLQGNFLKVNNAYSEITGYSEEELLQESCIGMSMPEDLPRLKKILAEVIEKGYVENIEKNCYAKNGAILTINMSIAMMPNQKNLLVTSKNVTKEVFLRHELEKQRLQYQQLMEYASDGIYIMDFEGRLLECNQRAAEMLGYSIEEMKTLTVTDWDAMIPACEIPALIRSVSTDKLIHLETKHKRRDGSLYDASITAVKIVIDEKELLYASARDITESVRLKEELKRYNEKLEERVNDEMQRRMWQEAMLIHQSRLASMGEMIGIIAHQWRQPINFLNALLFNLKDLYLRDALSPELVETSYRQAVETTEKLSHIIEDFRNFFNPSKTQEPFTLVTLIREAIEFLDNIFNLKGIDISIEVDPALQMTGYKNEILQIFINLFSNSLEAFSASGRDRNRLHIRAKRVDNHILIRVVDSGGGIPAEMLGTLFDPYASSKKATHGTGLGLYMCKLIIEEHHGGTIAAFSKEGETTIRMTIPVR